MTEAERERKTNEILSRKGYCVSICWNKYALSFIRVHLSKGEFVSNNQRRRTPDGH